jgi:hypothetical protein
MITQTARGLAPSRRVRAPRLGGGAEPRHLDLVLVATLVVSAVTATAILIARALAAVA